MDIYAKSIKMMLSDYTNTLQQISSNVKSFGGSGHTHGCIVDIDFYNHIYLNPIDGTITPYYATSMTDKYVYPNVARLLESHNKDLYDNYCKFISTHNNNSLLELKTVTLNENVVEFIPDTSIYKASNQMFNLQYLIKYNIIRKWSDDVILNLSTSTTFNADHNQKISP